MNLNLSFFEKNSLFKFFYYQSIVLFIMFIFIYILTYKKHSVIIVYLSVLFLFLYEYFYHVFFHMIIPKSLNVHLLFHHNHKHNENLIPYIINLTVEGMSNLFIFYVLYELQNILNLEIIPNIIIFYMGLLYTSIHVINYSIFHLDESHVLHHLSTDKKPCNYGPDVLDHLFGTNCNKRYEDFCHIIPNILLIFLITYYVFKPKLS